jgi:chaperone required for assembly of F1-ATPase
VEKPVKRFYREVAVAEVDDGYVVTLDGRIIKTQGRGVPQAVPTRALAQLLADEWARQGETIVPGDFPHSALADYAIDQIAPEPQAAIARIMRFAETDTLCYRADPDEPLFRRQVDVWEPVLTGFEQRTGTGFTRISGIVHRAQPSECLQRLASLLAAENALSLAGIEAMASLAASLVVGLEAAEPGSNPDTLWDAATLEEEWQAELWGREYTAEERRARRKADFLAARVFTLAARQP